jgi:hypothetical protein
VSRADVLETLAVAGVRHGGGDLYRVGRRQTARMRTALCRLEEGRDAGALRLSLSVVLLEYCDDELGSAELALLIEAMPPL